jgi:uncharacterized membrane protein
MLHSVILASTCATFPSAAESSPCWNDTRTKHSLISFITTGDPVTTLNRDRTNWVAKPIPAEVFFALVRTNQMQDINEVEKGRHAGHVLGLVVAAITGTMPFILAGTLGGSLIGKLTDHGITDKFIKEVSKKLEPETSALVMLGRSDPERRRKVVERLKPFHPKIMESDLPPSLEKDLEDTLHQHASV